MYTLLIVNVLLVLVVALGIWLMRLLSQIKKWENKYAQVQDEKVGAQVKAEHKAEEILEGARLESRHMLDESSHSAEGVIRELKAFTQDEKEAMLKGIREATAIQLREFQRQLSQELLSESKSLFTQMSEDAKADHAKAVAEIEVYKQERMNGVDKMAVELVGKVVEKVLGEGISLKQHEELIMKALEQAKREGVLQISNS